MLQRNYLKSLIIELLMKSMKDQTLLITHQALFIQSQFFTETELQDITV